MPSRAWTALAAFALSACALPAEPTAVVVGAAASKPPTCNPRVCGSPTVIMDCTYFSRLHSLGLPNNDGTRIVDVRRADNVALRLIAKPDRLVGLDPVTGAVLAEHQGLVGTRLTLWAEGALRTVTIAFVSTEATAEHFQIGGKPSIEAYDFAFVPIGLAALTSVRAIVYSGDEYDPLTLQVSVGPDSRNWMTVACRHSLPFALHTLGHTSAASQRLGVQTTVAKRQAMTHALSANVCGTGMSFATASEPITLTESQGMVPASSPYQDASTSTEAVWSATGAVCVDVPRMAGTTTTTATLLSAIAAECGRALPSCASLGRAWQDAGDVITGNPAAGGGQGL